MTDINVARSSSVGSERSDTAKVAGSNPAEPKYTPTRNGGQHSQFRKSGSICEGRLSWLIVDARLTLAISGA